MFLLPSTVLFYTLVLAGLISLAGLKKKKRNMYLKNTKHYVGAYVHACVCMCVLGYNNHKILFLGSAPKLSETLLKRWQQLIECAAHEEDPSLGLSIHARNYL